MAVGGGLTVSILVLSDVELAGEKWAARWTTYKEGKSLLELGDLLFGEGVSLSGRQESASRPCNKGCARTAPRQPRLAGLCSSAQGIGGLMDPCRAAETVVAGSIPYHGERKAMRLSVGCRRGGARSASAACKRSEGMFAGSRGWELFSETSECRVGPMLGGVLQGSSTRATRRPINDSFRD